MNTMPPARANKSMSENCTPEALMVAGPLWDATNVKLPCDQRSWCQVAAGR